MVGSGIRKKPIPDPGSGGQKGTGSRIRIRNTDIKLVLYVYMKIFYFAITNIFLKKLIAWIETLSSFANFPYSH
jgi:hypothetical protein